MHNHVANGDKLFHKYLGVVVVTHVSDTGIKADTGTRGILDFANYDFGKVLYFEKEHGTNLFSSYNEYLEFNEKEKKIRLQREAEVERENEKRRLKQIEEELEKERLREIEEENLKEERRQKQQELERLRAIQEEKKRNRIETQRKEADRVNNLKLRFINHLKENYLFDGFYHYTDFVNFINIMKMGKLLSRNRAKNLGFTDAARQSVIENTHISVKDYVRFYYKEKTPTIYDNEGIKIDNGAPHMPIPVVLVFNEEIIKHSNIAFSSGCGGSRYSIITRNIEDAYSFDWKTIFSRGSILVDEESIKRSIINKRNAEFLLHSEIDTKYIKKIIFRAPADMKTAITLLGRNDLFELDSNRLKFNYIHNFLYDYDIRFESNVYLVALKFHRYFNNYTHELRVKYRDDTEEKIDIEKINNARRVNIDKPLKYKDYDYYFYFKPLSPHNKVLRIEYLMNGHRSAVWEEQNYD
ncbi:DarT ssDNA thymidine ADP-ribosyltransferase family protein [Acetoanaerobium noterae]|uniref:DarT ssDNA thymidine ADP-ribosyltransferase family protein n=1 Tax=Acetoanaerobium noterae TaxID=745369 RepID=UPI00331F09FD